MALFARPVPHTRQPAGIPALNRSNPLASGLFGLLWGGDTLAGYDLITGLQFPTVTGRLNAQGGVGYGQASPGTSGGIVSGRNDSISANWRQATTQLSVVIVMTSLARASGAVIGGVGYGTGTGYALSEQFSDGTVRLTFSDGATKNIDSPSGALRLGQINVIVATFDGANARLYVNGVPCGSTASTTALTYAGSFVVTELSNTDAALGNGAAMAGHFMAGINRALTQAEISALAVNPWQVISPQIRKFWASAPGGAGTIGATPGTWSWAGTTQGLSALIATTPGTWSWAGTTAGFSALIGATPGTWSWSGTTQGLAKLIAATPGTWSWSGTTASFGSPVVNATPGTWQWAGTTQGLSALISATPGTWSWAGTSASITQVIPTTPGTWTWAGTTASFGFPTVNTTPGTWTWRGSTQTIIAGPAAIRPAALRSRFDAAPLQSPLDLQDPRWRKWFQDMWASVMGLGLPVPASLLPGASPYTWQFSYAGRGALIVQGGTVSKIEFSRDGTTFIDTGAVAGMMAVSQGDYLRITYTVAPTLTLVLH